MMTPLFGMCVACPAAVTLGRRTCFCHQHLVRYVFILHSVRDKYHLVLVFSCLSTQYIFRTSSQKSLSSKAVSMHVAAPSSGPAFYLKLLADTFKK